ncbi:Asp/Glu racemase [Brenneria roseae subsp. roseae]|uniref:aspartate/glutamate racemase family protein n=1 Tax=Brenneria roseae TaxID=1509241 RepID=UPI000D61D260|nr:aspartate/glutamate racemase family protein [Brenneria roseae]PWC17532.1 Asp/Glu racemase [Brenneria roseae subsp. roseae]
MKKAAVFHTSKGTLAMVDELAKKIMPDVAIMHIVEDSMIADVMAHHGVTPAINARIAAYVECANLAECDIFFTACSSIGGSVEQCQFVSPIPVMRIDEAMAVESVDRYNNIAVLATVGTTLAPTLDLIQRKAAERGKQPAIHSLLMSEAFTAFLAGELDKHDAIVAAGIRDALSKNCDAIVLAQASMSRVLTTLGDLPVPVLTSPERGIRLLKQRLDEMN